MTASSHAAAHPVAVGSAAGLRPTPEELPFPTPAQRDLLHAALSPAPRAAEAWRAWKARGMQLEAVDPASGRMFSQLWENRAAAGIDEADFPLLKGVYRQALAQNAVTIAGAFRIIAPLQSAGIPVVFLKGAALLAVSGGRLGVRRTTDVDILVPERDAEKAKAMLVRGDVVPKLGELVDRVGRRHAWTCRDANDTQVDLHWWAFKTAGDDQAIFDTAREATLIGRAVQVPSPTELLLSVVAGGFGGRGTAAPMRWIGDAMFLFALEGEGIDWSVFVERAVRPGITEGVRHGLRYLATEFDAPVPPHVLDALDGIPVTRRERLAYRAAIARPRVGVTFLTELELHRTRRLHDPAGTSRSFLAHLAETTGPGDGRQAAFVARHTLRAAQRAAGVVRR